MRVINASIEAMGSTLPRENLRGYLVVWVDTNQDISEHHHGPTFFIALPSVGKDRRAG